VIQQESKKELEFCDASAGPFNYCKISERTTPQKCTGPRKRIIFHPSSMILQKRISHTSKLNRYG
jgi:hypothetical protein